MSQNRKRIYLSPPDIRKADRAALLDALDSNWVAPVGPDVDAFEAELADTCGRTHGVALSSGTAALHLALLGLGVGAGDDVLVSTFTFAASANAVRYVGARPVFIDSEAATWNMAPALAAQELQARASEGRLPRAAVVVDLYGQCADYEALLPLFERYGVPVVSDAAESLGATHRDRPAGSFGVAAIVSFNGNKIITTSGGGMLVTDDPVLADRARFLATQARAPVRHYEHEEVGYNYRLSNLLAGLGRAQLRDLGRRVEARRRTFARYEEALEQVPGVKFMPEASSGRSNRWLTCITVDPALAGWTASALIDHLEGEDIEARPTWKPMHLQPAYRGFASRVDGTAERIFERGVCLPSGSSMSDGDQERVIDAIRGFIAGPDGRGGA